MADYPTREALVAQIAQDFGIAPKLVRAIVARTTAWAWGHPAVPDGEALLMRETLRAQAGYLRERDEARAEADRLLERAEQAESIVWRLLSPEEVRRGGFPDVAAAMEAARRG